MGFGIRTCPNGSVNPLGVWCWGTFHHRHHVSPSGKDFSHFQDAGWTQPYHNKHKMSNCKMPNAILIFIYNYCMYIYIFIEYIDMIWNYMWWYDNYYWGPKTSFIIYQFINTLTNPHDDQWTLNYHLGMETDACVSSCMWVRLPCTD